MKVARPQSGFRVVIKPQVADVVSASKSRWSRLPALFEGIVQRLKMTGHRDEETRALGGKWNRRLFVMKEDVVHGIPKIAVVYVVEGDTLKFEKILILEQ